MKIKLKVSKTLKRKLKLNADEKSLDRKVFIKESLLKHIEEKKDEWSKRIDGYEVFINSRTENLKLLKEELADNEEISDYEKQKTLKAFYKEHFMFLTVINKNRKLENIIVDLEEEAFYALQILAENKEQTIETYTTDLLHHIK